jgi:hypothetical protein
MITSRKNIFLPLILVCASFLFFQSVSAKMETDTLAGNHNRILVLMPNLRVETSGQRNPVLELVEGELTAESDDDFYELLVSVAGDSKVIKTEERNKKLYKKGRGNDIAFENACDETEADLVFHARYLFKNMPTLYDSDEKLKSMLSELSAEFLLYDCTGSTIVWKDNHSVFVPAATASYNELMKKMYLYITRRLPEIR